MSVVFDPRHAARPQAWCVDGASATLHPQLTDVQVMQTFGKLATLALLRFDTRMRFVSVYGGALERHGILAAELIGACPGESNCKSIFSNRCCRRRYSQSWPVSRLLPRVSTTSVEALRSFATGPVDGRTCSGP